MVNTNQYSFSCDCLSIEDQFKTLHAKQQQEMLALT